MFRNHSDHLPMQVKEYIRSNLHLPLSIPVICREFGINKTSLQERFKDYIGLSLHAYLIRGRMEKARLLLLETDDPVKIIAIECGYRRIHSFIKAFRITYHCSPGRYRRERLMIKSDIKAGESNIA